MGGSVRNYSGYFITLEGGEGSGKTTQAAFLVEELSKKRKVVLTREPGGTEIARQIRRILLDPMNTSLCARAELLLYAADRAQHIEEKILPALEEGAIVISDRFSDSTLAYQGFGRGLPRELIEEIDRIATSGLKPDLTLFFDVDPEISLSRSYKPDPDRIRKWLEEHGFSGENEKESAILWRWLSRKEGEVPSPEEALEEQTVLAKWACADRLEKEDMSFHKRVREGYLMLARENPERIRTIDASRDRETIRRELIQIVTEVLSI